jgi:nondiscriminating glutamyl-tRNA synthetase
MKIRTRYAPSPTGYLHIGGARTALFNYLFSKHYNGTFILRIEDTDIERNVSGGIESQYENLKWLGIIPDESLFEPGETGPYKQTEKLERYEQLAKELIERKKAYYCFCTNEIISKDRNNAENEGSTQKYSGRCRNLSNEKVEENIKLGKKPAIRIRLDENAFYSWDDLIRGKIEFPSSSMSEIIIMKSNGIPVYNFAVVVDDHDMLITHVLRGEEHIANTPYQLAIKNALGYSEDNISYGHLSIVTNEEGKKLSKRDTSVKQFIEDYKNEGYPADAFTNFLVLLGWTEQNGKEVMNIDELILSFSEKRISRSPTMFDTKKLEWMCSEYFKKMGEKEYLDFVLRFIKECNEDSSWVKTLALAYKNQIHCANQLNDFIQIIKSEEISLTNESVVFLKSLPNINEMFDCIEDEIKAIDKWEVSKIKELINKVKDVTKASGKNLFMPMRLILIGQEHGPELASVIYLKSRDKCINNLHKTKELVNAK